MASSSVQYTVLRARVENRNLSALLARIAHIVIRDATCAAQARACFVSVRAGTDTGVSSALRKRAHLCSGEIITHRQRPPPRRGAWSSPPACLPLLLLYDCMYGRYTCELPRDWDRPHARPTWLRSW